MSQISDLREKIVAVVVAALPELHGYAKVVPNVTVPALMAFPPDRVGYDETESGGYAGGSSSLAFPLRIYVERAQNGADQDTLDAYISPTGPQSIKQVLSGNPSLDRTVDDCRVVEASGYGNWPIGSVTYLGVELQIVAMLS